VLGPLLAPYAPVTIDDLVRAHYAGMRAMDVEEQSHDDWAVYNDAFVRAAGVPAHDVAEAAHLLGVTRSPWLWRWPITESVLGLRSLHEAGVPIGVVSNASGQIERALARFGVCQVGVGDGVPVVVVVDSHVVGVAKPDPAIFRHALEVLGCEPARVGYVGDSVRNDVGGARRAGLVPFLFDPFADHAGGPHERVRSVRDLQAFTRSL
jgi:putative hydrolase of the HAD superfamily